MTPDPEEPEGTSQPDPSLDNAPSSSEPAEGFPIVGIGASAGGLAAFEQFFTALPPDTGMAFVVVQHLSPPHKSILPEILQRFTTMPVAQVTEGVEVKPDGVYVIPPGSDLALKNGHLTLLKPAAVRGYRLPIDFFFRSLAQDQGERAIGIVLSGTGVDGSLGLKSIKAEGGLTIAQEPHTAEYADMPRNAIATKEVDFVLPPEKMSGLILKYTRHQVLDAYKRAESDFHIPAGGLQELYYLIRAKTGHDFSFYKQNTLMRRIERRMKVNLVKSIEEYITYLEQHPEEITALFQEMLINVTHFFRDPEAFHALVEKAIKPLILARHRSPAPLRVWVAGCSSGEEAYSVAIAIQEQFEALKSSCKVQIYATDLDGEAVVAARKGFYSDGSLENVSAQRLQRFFLKGEEGYQIKKNLRDMVVFSTQNVISDPPFSRIDLLCCRNLMIYLEHELQNQLFLQFHYSLSAGGILFLGNSESIGTNHDLFAVMDRKYKIFQRKEGVTPTRGKTRTRLAPQKAVSNALGASPDHSAEGGLREWVEQALLEFHTPACVVIDQKNSVLFIHGRTGKFLEPVSGEPSSNLIRMAREGLKTELTIAIHAAIANKETVRRAGVQVKTNGDFHAINLTVRPAAGPADLGDLMLVVFEEAADAHPKADPPEPIATKPETPRAAASRRVGLLQKELKEKDEYLHTIIDELENANQDLKSTNEELQSTNEEMQSTNEELETSKEELQSINEELSTINAELQNKNEELSAVNNDIYNLLSSIEIGTIFLDLDLQIRRFTPAVEPIYSLLPGDVGRPIANFVSSLEDDHLVEDVRQVLRDLIPKAIEVQSKDDTWYLISIKPYRTLENVIDGAVITFVDISEQKQGDELRRLGTILQDSNDAITVQDFTGKILHWNRGATELYGWSEAEALAMNSLEMMPESARADAVKLYKRLAKGERIRSFETQRVTRDGKTLEIWITLTALVDDDKQPVGVATTERDFTDRKQDRQAYCFENRALKALNQWVQTLLDHPTALSQSAADVACRMLIKEGGYRLAWIGKVKQDKSKTITPVAWAGAEHEELKRLAKANRTALRRALASRGPVIVRDRLPDLSAQGTDPRCASLLALPMFHGEDCQGVLVICAPEPDAFIESEVEALAAYCSRVAQVVCSEWQHSERQEK